MNRNTLKIIACISMLIDHIGYIFFPEIPFFRFIGRIAMPIFAFFIGEGCLYTRDRKKYFLRVFILGIICQAVYVIESLITGSDGWGYMNILLTFSFSIVLCSAFLYAKEQGEKGQKLKGAMVCLSVPVLLLAIHIFCQSSEAVIGTKIEFDYGVSGMMLPVFACIMILNSNLGIMAKVAPQMNMFAVGIQLKIIVGFLVLFITITFLPSIADMIFTEMRKMMVLFIEGMY